LGSPWQTLPDFLYRQRRNFKASSTFWLEITYSVEGAQIFYTRTFLQHEGYSGEIADLEKELDEIIAEGKGEYKSGDDLLDLPRLADTFDKWLEKLQPGRSCTGCRLRAWRSGPCPTAGARLRGDRQ
jgi:hypothetical protein